MNNLPIRSIWAVYQLSYSFSFLSNPKQIITNGETTRTRYKANWKKNSKPPQSRLNQEHVRQMKVSNIDHKRRYESYETENQFKSRRQAIHWHDKKSFATFGTNFQPKDELKKNQRGKFRQRWWITQFTGRMKNFIRKKYNEINLMYILMCEVMKLLLLFLLK